MKTSVAVLAVVGIMSALSRATAQKLSAISRGDEGRLTYWRRGAAISLVSI